MNNEEQQEELMEEQGKSERGPGHLLAKKREALGLSVQDVADTLHITMHYVRALETDAHDKLPGDVFIKGYLRSYASLLQLDPMVIINVYLDFSSKQRKTESEYGMRRRSNSFGVKRKRRIPWIVVSGIAFVGMAIALWLFSSGSATPERPSATPGATSTSSVTTRTLRTGVPATLDQVASSVEMPTISELLESAEPNAPLEAPAEQADVLVEAEDTPADVSSATAETPPQSDPLSTDSAVQDEVISGTLISVDGGGEDLVQFIFTGPSMVQVTDANDEQLYRDVRTAGDLLRISGIAPFNILLGDALNSQLSFNGDTVDFSSSIRIDNSARLTIGL